MGFGTEILFILALGALMLGPKRLPAILGHIARAKGQIEKATQTVNSRLEVELGAQGRHEKTDSSEEAVRRQ